MTHVTFVRGDDWVAMYVNGRKVMEGHSLTNEDVIRDFVDTTQSMEVSHEWLTWNELPEYLGSIPQEARL